MAKLEKTIMWTLHLTDAEFAIIRKALKMANATLNLDVEKIDDLETLDDPGTDSFDSSEFSGLLNEFSSKS